MAGAIARDTHLLFLDELHVTDFADALILSRLLNEILRLGTLLVITTNRSANDLYKGGPSRKYFKPLVRLEELAKKCNGAMRYVS